MIIVAKTGKQERLNIRIERDLKEEFNTICQEQSLNASALIRQWISEFVEENQERVDDPTNMDILDIAWRLNEHQENSIKPFCFSIAQRLGYEDNPNELFDDIVELLIERAKKRGSFEEVDGAQYGKALVNKELLYFALVLNGGSWCIEPPAWLSKVSFD